MYEAGIKYLLGLRIEKGVLSLEPCIPSNWKEYSLRYQWHNTVYHIHVSNPNAKCTGVSSVTLNGNEVTSKQIPLQENAGIYSIEVIM